MTKLIDRRLQAVYNQIDCKKVVDVGCDHGKLVAQLFLDKKINKAILTDISVQSLDKAKKLMSQYEFNNKCEFIVGDGLCILNNDFSDYQCIIAGMGGEQIIKILSNPSRKDNITNFVLQPMKNSKKLRQWLVDNDYKIIVDKMTKQNKMYYDIIKVCRGKDKLTYPQLVFGKTNLSDVNNDFLMYLKNLKSKFAKIVNNPKCQDNNVKQYYMLICKVLQNLKEE